MSKTKRQIQLDWYWLGRVPFGLYLGAVTGVGVRLATTPASGWLYTIIVGYFVSLLAAMLAMGLFVFVASLFSSRPPRFFAFSLTQMPPKIIGLTLVTLLMAAAGLALAYNGFYGAATGTALIFFLLLLSLIVVSQITGPINRKSLYEAFFSLLYLIPILMMCAGASLVLTLFGSLGLITILLLLLFDTLFPAITNYWLLSGLLCGTIVGAVVLAIASYRPPRKNRDRRKQRS